MVRVLRGEIRLADLNPMRGQEQSGTRPVIILSHDVLNERSGTAIAMALTLQVQRADFPVMLELESVRFPSRRGSRSAKFAGRP